MSKLKKWLLLWFAGCALLVLGCVGVLGPCWSSLLLDGLWVARCPAGSARQEALLRVDGVGPQDWGTVDVLVRGLYRPKGQDGHRSGPVYGASVRLFVVDPDGKESAVEPRGGWSGATEWDGSGELRRYRATVKLPEGPDGDWTLRAEVATPLSDSVVSARLPVYAPALAHVVTDSPLYKPGQVMHFRAVLLHEADLTPLGGRPGTWKVWDPAGNLVLEERGKASPMGVVASTFPLDPEAESGNWKVHFESGAAADELNPEVRVFRLPRFTVDAKSEQPWWRIGESPVVSGTIRYTSGAPLRNAAVRVRLVVAGGEWPPPNNWLEPTSVQTDGEGRFRVALGQVPGDLVGLSTLQVQLDATDPTGDTASGAATVLLSRDSLLTDTVTELADGLIPSFNNRLYLRVSTPDGVPLRGATVRLRKEWDSGDPGVTAEADADGVARFQVDPEEPVTVVEPGIPTRPTRAAKPPPVEVADTEDLLAQTALDVNGRVSADRWALAAAPCADLVRGDSADVDVVLLLEPGGGARRVEAREGAESTALSRCVAGALHSLGAPAGAERLWKLSLRLHDQGGAKFDVQTETSVGADPGELDEVAEVALVSARPCLRGLRERSDLPHVLLWEVTKGQAAVRWRALPNPDDTAQLDPFAAGCAERALQGLALPGPADADAMGVLRVSATPATADAADAPPQPRTWPGFAWEVVASLGGEEKGRTTLRMKPGTVPPLRVRFSDVIVDAGSTVTVTAIKGPGFSGNFPRKLHLTQGDRSLAPFDFDPERKTGTVTIPADTKGFVAVEILGTRALLYVRPTNTLTVGVTAADAVLRPGGKTTLTVDTKDPQGPVRAGVLLSGVDSTLGQLVTLPGAGDFARITVRSTTDRPAFGTLDARALETGLVSGANAAQATVLRVSSVPGRATGARRGSGSGESLVDLDTELQASFYGLLREVRATERAWEAKAAEGEVLTPKKMLQIYEEALAKHPATDPFGNPLSLGLLPPDLLALTDPRFIVSDGARLPEDVDDWSAFVAREAK